MKEIIEQIFEILLGVLPALFFIGVISALFFGGILAEIVHTFAIWIFG